MSWQSSLPNGDFLTDLVHFTEPFEIGGGVRYLSCADTNVLAAFPVMAWDRGGRWRTMPATRFAFVVSPDRGQTTGASVLVREIWRATWRVGLPAAYAYGIESFEDLTAGRLGALGSHTLAAGLRVRTATFTQVFATWEHQWRSNDTRMDRFTLAVVRSFP